MSISVGQVAPDFTLLNQEKKEVKLSDFAGKKNVVLVWYPLDWSPTCTNEHVCFVNDMKNFDQLDAEVLGVSVDSVWSHKAFADKMGIKYSLLADFHPRGAMSEKYGIYLADKGITGRAIAIWPTRESPAAPSPSSIKRAKWLGSKIMTFPSCRISRKSLRRCRRSRPRRLSPRRPNPPRDFEIFSVGPRLYTLPRRIP